LEKGVTDFAIGPDAKLYVSSDKLYVFDAAGANPKELSPAGYANIAIGPGRMLHLSASGAVTELNADGAKQWQFDTLVANASVPAVGADGTTYVGLCCRDYFDGREIFGALAALDPAGHKLWELPAQTDTSSQPRPSRRTGD
jgi:hypothetical protein